MHSMCRLFFDRAASTYIDIYELIKAQIIKPVVFTISLLFHFIICKFAG